MSLSLAERFDVLKQHVETKVAELAQASKQVRADRSRFNLADNAFADATEANDILQAVSQKLQQHVHTQICTVVSKCLSVVFEEPYSFEIEFDRKRNRTQANLRLVRDGLVLGNPMDATGGGVIDVAAFALRVSVLLLQRPARRRLLVLDEPFKFVHPPERRPRIVAMLQMLAEEFGVQFVIVTGIDELRCGKVISLEDLEN